MKNLFFQYMLITTSALLTIHSLRAQGTLSKGIACVAIGPQLWTQNLNVDRFRDGNLIAEARTDKEWEAFAKLEIPAWRHVKGDKNGEVYGKLYNWFAVSHPSGLAPEGCHIPTEMEWRQLIDYLGGDQAAPRKMKSSSGWNDEKVGSNSSGFGALPAGQCECDGDLDRKGICGFWWCSNEFDVTSANRVLLGNAGVTIVHYGKCMGFSVRCVVD
jgi:uncharacterized protein (TIGR02145 family)